MLGTTHSFAHFLVFDNVLYMPRLYCDDTNDPCYGHGMICTIPCVLVHNLQIRKKWGERYHEWITKAERKMEELQQINIML